MRRLLGVPASATQRDGGLRRPQPRAGSPPFLKEIQQAVWSVNPSLPLAEVRTVARGSRPVDGPDLVHAGHARDRRRRRAAARHRRHLRRDRLHRSRSARARSASAWRSAPPVSRVRRMFVLHGLALDRSGRRLRSGRAPSLLTRPDAALLFEASPLDPLPSPPCPSFWSPPPGSPPTCRRAAPPSSSPWKPCAPNSACAADKR